MKHKIILPNPIHFDRRRPDCRVFEITRCMRILEVYERDVIVEIDSGELKDRIPKPVYMGNDNGRYSSFFTVDKNLFMIVDADGPILNHKEWVKYYEEQGVKGYFVACHRYSTKFIFDDCKVPAFPLPGKPGSRISLKDMEHEAHSRSVAAKKDINVFFQGRFNTRVARIHIAKLITNAIPNCRIENCSKNIISSEEYIDRMCRSKIAWCPRSVLSEPDHECNAPIAKEFEAMCLEIMVLKPPIGTIEVEERISGIHFAEVNNDSSDLIEKIRYYLEHDNERKEIAHNGRLYFERNCSTFARAHQIFNDCLKAIDAV